MTTYFIDECKERIALHSKLLMATIGVMVLDAGGMASLIAMQSDPPIFGSAFSLLEAGGVMLILFAVAAGYFLREIDNRINQIGRAK